MLTTVPFVTVCPSRSTASTTSPFCGSGRNSQANFTTVCVSDQVSSITKAARPEQCATQAPQPTHLS